jgi:hypothetical protein
LHQPQHRRWLDRPGHGAAGFPSGYIENGDSVDQLAARPGGAVLAGISGTRGTIHNKPRCRVFTHTSMPFTTSLIVVNIGETATTVPLPEINRKGTTPLRL